MFPLEHHLASLIWQLAKCLSDDGKRPPIRGFFPMSIAEDAFDSALRGIWRENGLATSRRANRENPSSGLHQDSAKFLLEHRQAARAHFAAMFRCAGSAHQPIRVSVPQLERADRSDS